MYTESQMASIRGELEIVQKALKLQTKRCSQLVAEYTRKLQEKEQQFQTEKTLRDDQLGKVLKALLIVEARLRQEQKLITHQLNEKDYIIKNLLSNQYCKNCNQLYRSSPLQESLDSNYSEYHDFESLDSSSETYLSEKGKSDSSESKNNLYRKNHNKDSIGRRSRNKFPHRKSVGTYFEVLKIRNENSSPFSNEDNTSNDYDNLDSLPTESKNDESDINKTIANQENEENRSKITDSIPVFDGETNDNNWYATSDQEDEQQRDIYRDNPVLECMNQILIQNMQDNCSSPPKTPNIERKSMKRVKFSDEEDNKQENVALTADNLKESSDYYETPIQKPANFYETPQSIYSNDYEQILTKTSDQDAKNHYYIDMDTNKMEADENVVVRKSKILRTPPALPPKPANLASRYRPPPKDSSEPDYCSISELNLPPKSVSFKKINVVAEINAPTSNDVRNKLEKANNKKDVPTNLVVKKCVEKLNIQIAKQTAIKSEKCDQDIPKLPQVSEIIIPDEEDEKNDRITQDNYVKNNSQILKTKTTDNNTNLTTNRHPIVIGSSVSSLISGFNNQLLSEIKKKPKTSQFTSFENMQNFDKTATNNNFDLSQNFEEFKLDDCEIEEYKVDDDVAVDENTVNVARVDMIRATNDLLIPKLNTNNVELLKKQLENHENRSEATYEHFLECTGLSSKSILTPSRMMSNHKNMLKPKDVKLRSKVKANQFLEKNNGSSKKYWSEPYI